ncbi:MAG TPA: FHA domain-containing protein [bacterium]|nr:FHA domain-containing protein [bacterium]
MVTDMADFELVLEDQKGDIVRYDVLNGSFVLGRGSNVDMRIRHPSVSRQHAMINNEAGTIEIRDLGSRNGTFVNGEPVMEKRLAADDLISLGAQPVRLREKQALKRDGGQDGASSPLSGMRMFVRTPQELMSQFGSENLFPIEELLGSRQGPKVEAIRQQYDSMRSLFAISNTLASESDTSIKLQAVLERVVEHVKGEFGYILLIDEKTKRLAPLYSCSLVPGKATISKSLAETVVKEGVSVLTDDAMADSRFSSSESVSKLRIHSALVVPIWTEESLLGVLYVSHHHKVAWFDKRHLAYASAVGKQMGMAVARDGNLRKNMALVKYLGSIRRSLEQKLQEQSSDVKRCLSRQEQVLQQLVRSASLRTLGNIFANLAYQIDKPLAILMPRLRFIAKYVETLEGICEQLSTALSSASEGNAEAVGRPDFRQPVRKIRETLLVCQSEIAEIQLAAKFLRSFSSSELPSKVNLNEVVGSLIVLLDAEFEKSSIVVEKELAEPPVELLCDELGLVQTLFGTVLNSIESLKQKPPRADVQKRIKIAVRKDRDDIIITVSDNGIGIAEEHKLKAFDPFFTTREETGGIGLGLTKARNFVLKHNGHISFNPGEGPETTLRITLSINSPRHRTETNTLSMPEAIGRDE